MQHVATARAHRRASFAKSWTFALTLCAVALTGGHASAVPGKETDPSECDAVLKVRNTSVLTQRSIERLATLTLVTQQNFDEMRNQFEVSFPGYFDGGFTSFNQRRQKELSLNSFNR